jgi:hypothetical protein
MDCDWRGCIIAVAFSEEEARDFMKGAYNYEPDKPLVRKPLMEVGLVHVNLGDC